MGGPKAPPPESVGSPETAAGRGPGAHAVPLEKGAEIFATEVVHDARPVEAVDREREGNQALARLSAMMAQLDSEFNKASRSLQQDYMAQQAKFAENASRLEALRQDVIASQESLARELEANRKQMASGPQVTLHADDCSEV